ncbi:MAG TPA: hypothetical protein VEF76_14220 [Patescibacteria group bacterium]|nr:hypothetical protein [Patescibacteria group bacterium]
MVHYITTRLSAFARAALQKTRLEAERPLRDTSYHPYKESQPGAKFDGQEIVYHWGAW